MSRVWRYAIFGSAVVAPAIAAIVLLALKAPTKPRIATPASDDVATAIASTNDQPDPSENEPIAVPPGFERPKIDDLIEPDSRQKQRQDNKPAAISAPKIPTDEQPAPGRMRPDPKQGDIAPLVESGEIGSEESVGESNVGQRKPLRREGTQLVNAVGSISKKGNQISFQPLDGSGPLFIMQNQFLERIEEYEAARSREGTRGEWKLSGRVTEYRGTNYLLVTSAMLVGAGSASPP